MAFPYKHTCCLFTWCSLVWAFGLHLSLHLVLGESGIEQFTNINGSLHKLLVDDHNNVFIAGKDAIFHFKDGSPDTLIARVDVVCDTSNCSEQSSSKSDRFPSVFQVISFSGSDYLLVCGFSVVRTCYLHSTLNITQSWMVEPYAGSSELFLNSAQTAVIVTHSSSSPSEYYFFAALGLDDEAKDVSNTGFTFSRNGIQRRPDVSFADLVYTGSGYIKSKSNNTFTFIYGFETHEFNATEQTLEYVYFLRNTVAKSGHTIASYISQLCANDDYFRSYMEARLECNGYTELITATTLVTISGQILIASFSGGTRHDGGSVCAYKVSSLGAFFDEQRHECFVGSAGSSPDWIQDAKQACVDDHTVEWRNIECGYTGENRRILVSVPLRADTTLLVRSKLYSSIAATRDGNGSDIILYLGSTAGSIEKMLFSSDFRQSLTLFNISTRLEGGQVQSLVLNKASTRLFYIQANKAFQVSLDDCGLHLDCHSCLADVTAITSCSWVVAEVSFCTRRFFIQSAYGNASKNDVFQNYCPPVVSRISPTRGPRRGGTMVTIEGMFSNDLQDNSHVNADVGVMLGTTPCHEVDAKSYRLTCLTGHGNASSSDTVVVSIAQNQDAQNTVHTMDDRRFRQIPILGDSLNTDVTFQYQVPMLDVTENKDAMISGGSQIRLRGQRLHIGTKTNITIGGRPCVISENDIYNDTIVTCKAPSQLHTGNYSVRMRIDDATVKGPYVTYVPDTVFDSILPVFAHTIRSGGILITVSGENICGIGTNVSLGIVNQNDSSPITMYGPCEVSNDSNETHLICRTGKALYEQAVGVEGVVSLRNAYGALLSPNGTITIHPDPQFDAQQTVNGYATTHNASSNYVELLIQAQYLPPVHPVNVVVSIGSHSCRIRDIKQTSIMCELQSIDDKDYDTHMVIYCKIGACSVGNIGTAILHKKLSETDVGQDTSGGPANNMSTTVLIVTACVVVVGVLGLAVGRHYYRSMRRRHNKDEPYSAHYHNDNILTLDGLSEGHASEAIMVRQNTYQKRTCLATGTEAASDMETSSALAPLLDTDTLQILQEHNLLIDSDDIILGEVVGQGHFGSVFKAYLQKDGVKEEDTVAAKTMHRNNPKDLDVYMFVKEALIMKDFQHKNVMQLIGLCFGIERLPLVILPFMKKGDVLSYIRDENNVPTVRDLVLFSVDIANGMDYLSQLKFVHRDLAARNCMIDEDMTVKVADFGLSRDVYEREYYSSCDKTTKLPVKWMSPESLEFGHFSSKSDIWSFGVVLWELLTRGMNPYPTVDNWDMMRYLKEDRRLSKPDFCPEEMYKIMLRCWNWDADDRPSFGELCDAIPQLLRRLQRHSGKRRRLESKQSQQSDTSV